MDLFAFLKYLFSCLTFMDHIYDFRSAVLFSQFIAVAPCLSSFPVLQKYFTSLILPPLPSLAPLVSL